MNINGLVESVDMVTDILNFSVHSNSIAGEFVVVLDKCIGCLV